MLRRPPAVLLAGALCGAALALPSLARAQDHGGHAGHVHDHAGGPVECRSLAAPPWPGLLGSDLDLIRRVEASVAHLGTPEAAAGAGFSPQFGNIPTMGVHWVNARRMRDGFRLDEPDHLMFAPVGGRDELVGVAYAFRGPPDAPMPEAFQSELAMWHDHPELGGPGQTLHMLHVWRVPSPYGPFAGNNFFLPFLAGGLATPDPCWIQGGEDVELLELVASTLSLIELASSRSTAPGTSQSRILGTGQGVIREQFLRAGERLEGWTVALDTAARGGDREAWLRAANGLIDALGPVQRQIAERLRDRVKGIQEPGAFPGGT